MTKRSWAAWIIAVVACWGIVGASLQAQVPMTGAGKAKPGGAVGYQGPGDLAGFSTGVLFWWGLRGYSSTYSGNVADICDNTTGLTCVTATWSSAGGGTLSIPNVGGFPCDNSTHKCEIKTFYDQSGNSGCGGSPCHTTNGPGARPILVINCLGSKPCASVGGTQLQSAAVISASTSQPYTNSVVALQSSAGQATIAQVGGNTSQSLFGSSSGTVGMYAGNSVPTVSATINVAHTLQFLFNNASSYIYVDADTASASNPVSLGTSNSIASGTAANFPSNTSGGLTGQVFEAGWWAGDKSANFAAMHSQQCAYWGTTC